MITDLIHLEISSLMIFVASITLVMTVIDLRTNRIPNILNLALFVVVTATVLCHGIDPIVYMVRIIFAVVIALMLHRLHVLGGGDCKYIMAVSPVLEILVLAKLVLLAMIYFVIGYWIQWIVKFLLFRREKPGNSKGLLKKPFVWSFIPGWLTLIYFQIL